ncbi:SRPBCC domain-containing protein [Nonomuraea sp. NPDC049480]|uniref:SRPBCC domain-containing protein n=1 Tax=Nonomuraea sp. NPDC049480 TaxID=3364353 RepID=UPI0037A458C0
MGDVFEMTFVLDLRVEQAWQVFTTPDYLEAWLGTIVECDIRPGGRIRFTIPGHGELIWSIEQAEEHKRLVWLEPPAAVPSERRTTVTFKETAKGTRVRIQEAGFGESDAWRGHLDGTRHGWTQNLAGLHLYLRTGVKFDRMNTFRADLGAHLVDTPAGPEVVSVAPGGFADQAVLRSGDIVVRLGAAPVFDIADVWLFCREHTGGTEVSVTFVRDGTLRTAHAILGYP